jgi:DNA (cytosine-5)-methyltransferase 1
MTQPVLLDLFCCEGGAGRGYADAGFEVVGVDIAPQPRYPFEFVKGNAVDFLWSLVRSRHFGSCRYVAVHASTPCQAWSDLQKQNKRHYEDFIEPVRDLLEALGLPYVIENVEGAPLRDPVTLCGTMFPGLRVIRHRLFETNWPLEQPPHPPGRHPLVFTHDKRKAHHGKLDQNRAYVQVTGGGNCTIANKRAAMGTPWMSGHGCNEAVPPAYTRWIGERLLEHINTDRLELAA